MNKEIFLKELRECLGILEEKEQEDILEEYAQHIDMKMQKGLSEEEAIQDFGSIDELAAQILEAYHVNPQFSEKKKFIHFSKPNVRTADAGDGKKPFAKAFGWIKRKTLNAAYGIKNAFLWMGRQCRAFGGWLMKPFRRKKIETDEAAGENQINERGAKKMAGGINRCLKAIGKGIASLWRLCCDFCIWSLKLIWNLGWLMFSMICAFMAMIVLMGLGAVSVLLFQGYPFVGIFFISLGALLCFGALSCGAFSLLIRKKEDKNDKDKENIKKAEESDVEVQYE